MTKRRKFSPDFKARVVMEMLTEQKSAAQASREYGIKDSVLSRWKQEFIERSPQLFEQGNRSLTIRESSTESSMPWKDGSPRTSPQDKLAFIKGNVGLSAYQLETAPHQPGFGVL